MIRNKKGNKKKGNKLIKTMKANLIFAIISFFALSSYSAAADCAKYKSKVQQAICEKIEEAKGIASGKIESKTTKKEKVKKEKIKKESKQPKTLKALGDLLKERKKKERRRRSRSDFG